MREELLEQAGIFLYEQLDPAVIEVLCDAACRKLDSSLADGVTVNDCAEAYLAAGLWLVVGWARELMNWKGIVSISAGDMQARLAADSTPLEGRAMRLMGPWLKDRNFVFLGVKG